MPALDEYERDDRAVCCHAVCIRTSPKAILVKFDDEDEEMWVPQSQIHDDSEVYSTGDDGQLVITRWIAEQKGWL